MRHNHKKVLISPYLGDGSVEFGLLGGAGIVNKLIVNDIDPQLMNFYYVVMNETDNFIDNIINTSITKEKALKSKQIILENKPLINKID